jgi:broad specificity phosphatase PhoE
MPSAAKRVLLIRHGEGVHNRDEDHDIVDPRLTALGRRQSRALRSHPAVRRFKPELIIVSPLSRAIETAALAFGKTQSPCEFLLTERHSERVIAPCDTGSRKSKLLKRFPFIKSWQGFRELKEVWTKSKDMDRKWRCRRAPAFRKWVDSLPEQRVVIVGHGAFFEALCGRYLHNCGVRQLRWPSTHRV